MTTTKKHLEPRERDFIELKFKLARTTATIDRDHVHEWTRPSPQQWDHKHPDTLHHKTQISPRYIGLVPKDYAPHGIYFWLPKYTPTVYIWVYTVGVYRGTQLYTVGIYFGEHTKCSPRYIIVFGYCVYTVGNMLSTVYPDIYRVYVYTVGNMVYTVGRIAIYRGGLIYLGCILYTVEVYRGWYTVGDMPWVPILYRGDMLWVTGYTVGYKFPHGI